MMNKQGQQKYIYAIRNVSLQQNTSFPSTIGALSQHFVLAIAGTINKKHKQAHIVEQQKNKFNQPHLSFQSKGIIQVAPQNIIVALPIICIEEDSKFRIPEEEFRRIVIEIKTIINQQESDDSQFDRLSQQLHINSIDHKFRGRPRGSKNRKKESVQKSSGEQYLDQSQKKQEKRGRGRPKGAKNIKKQAALITENNFNELNIFDLFVSLFESKSIEEVNTKINRMRDKDDRLLIKKEQMDGQEGLKRSRGRPKGVKNKPKLNNQESQSQQTQQLENLPKRKQKMSSLSNSSPVQIKRLLLQGKKIDQQELINLAEPIGVQDHRNVLLTFIKSGDLNALKRIFHRKNSVSVSFPMSWDINSRLAQNYYTVRTKKQYIYKGKREGINALLQDCQLKKQHIWWKNLGVDTILSNLPNSKQGIQMYQYLIEQDAELKRETFMNISSLVRSGNEVLAAYLLEKVLKQEQNLTSFGYGKQHLDCLSRSKIQMQFKKASILKQSYTMNFCSPIHCAVINSNTELLSFILKHISQFNVGDSLNRKPIHYAAVLDNPKALEMLVKHGADLKDMDKKKTTPLMLAAQYGRVKNVKIILQKVRDPQYINFKGQQGLAAVHYACVEGHIDLVKLMLQDSLVQRMVQTKEGMTLFHLAAGNGQKQLLKYLFEFNQNSDQGDHFRKTPLMIAIRNHQNQSFFYLFQNQARYYKRDYSYNTLLHYAAAYGNIQIVKYLLDLGMQQTMNRRSFYPFQIAVLKGHFQCAKFLQNWSLHLSHHLINRLSQNPRNTREYLQIFEYLLQTRKYDLNYRNPNAIGQTCLHLICNFSQLDYRRIRGRESSHIAQNQYQQMMAKLIGLLLEYGADPQIENDRGYKAVNLCIENENIVGIQLLLKTIPFDLQPPTRNNNYVFYLTNIAIMGPAQMQFVYQRLIDTDQKILRTQIKKVDINGFSFIVYLIKRFTQNVHSSFRNKFIQAQKISTQKNAIDKQNEAILVAFNDYLKHQEFLIKVINYLVELGSDPKFIVSEPKMDEEYENYKKWGIQHFLMKFPSPNLLKIFMKWIDTHFNLQNSQGRTPLHLFCLWNSEGCLFNNYSSSVDSLPIINLPQLAPFYGTACLQYLLQNGLTSNVLDINRSTPLLYAASRGQINFIRLLRNFGSTINNINSLNQVPLIELIYRKNDVSISDFQAIIADEGVRIDFKDLNERNCLHHLVSIAKNFDNSPELCKLLIDKGLDVNSLDKFGRSPLFYCFIRIDQKDITSETGNDKVEILQTLLAQANINTNIIDVYHRTPLHYACQSQFFFSMLYLLQKQGQKDIVDTEGNTPLAICLKNKNLNQAAVLIKEGVKAGKVVEDGTVYSYISYAIQKLSIGICFILIEHGYPLETALQEAHPYTDILARRYSK